MPIRNTWYIPERVILTYIYDDLTVPDARISAQESIALLRSTHQTVHNIVDLREVTRFPRNFHQLTPLTACMQEPNHGWMLLVMQKNAVLNFVTNIVMRTIAQHYQVFTDHETLLRHLPGLDRDLPTPLPPYVLERDTNAVFAL